MVCIICWIYFWNLYGVTSLALYWIDSKSKGGSITTCRYIQSLFYPPTRHIPHQSTYTVKKVSDFPVPHFFTLCQNTHSMLFHFIGSHSPVVPRRLFLNNVSLLSPLLCAAWDDRMSTRAQIFYTYKKSLSRVCYPPFSGVTCCKYPEIRNSDTFWCVQGSDISINM